MVAIAWLAGRPCYNQKLALVRGGSLRASGGIGIWLIIVVALLAVFLVWQYVGYSSATRALPDDMTMAGLLVEGMSCEEALNALEVAFATPIDVTYLDQQLALPPDIVEFRYRADETAANLDTALEEWRGLEGFVAYVLRHSPGAVDVPVAVGYSNERVDGYLSRVANQFDQLPQDSVPLPGTKTCRPRLRGYELDTGTSRPRLTAALVSAVERKVELAVITGEAPPLSVDALEQIIRSLLDGRGGVLAGVFIKDLKKGDELEINADVAYSGLDVLKIAILAETYRALGRPPGSETTRLISETMAVAGIAAADPLLRDVIDGGDSRLGAEKLTASMRYLGLVNTFLVSGYDEDETPSAIVTPANSRTDVFANPDSRAQTTALEVGLLLEMIYQCSRDGGALMAAYPGSYTADECTELIGWMSESSIDRYFEAGIPVGTAISHRSGWAEDTYADAGLVYSPGGDFVVVTYLYRPQWLDPDEGAAIVSDITTAAYNCLNLLQ